jgi:hypothetical protein
MPRRRKSRSPSTSYEATAGGVGTGTDASGGVVLSESRACSFSIKVAWSMPSFIRDLGDLVEGIRHLSTDRAIRPATSKETTHP